MRYHWGLGVGHHYAHLSQQPTAGEFATHDNQPPESEPADMVSENDFSVQIQDGNSDVYDSDDSELGLEYRDLEGLADAESDDQEGECEDEDIEEADFTGI
jgi:hypothetical protein